MKKKTIMFPEQTAQYREHPIKILRYSMKNLWLFIFPLLRTIRITPFSWAYLLEWGRGAVLNLAVAWAVIVIGVLRWASSVYTVDSYTLRATSGIFLRRTTEIPFSRISASHEKYPFYLRPFQAAHLRISTAHGSFSGANLDLLLLRRDLSALRRRLPRFERGGRAAMHAPGWQVFAFSALFSSAFSGGVFTAWLLIQSGRVARTILEELHAQRILSDVASQPQVKQHGIPQIVILIGTVMIALWLISFVRNLLRYMRFRIRFGRDTIAVDMGLLTVRHYRLRRDSIIFPDLQQTLLMKLMGLTSVYIRCPGYAADYTASLPVLLPLLKERESTRTLRYLRAALPEKEQSMRFRPPLWTFWSFIWQPVLAALLLTIARYLLVLLVPAYFEVMRYLWWALMIAMLWVMIVRLTGLFMQYCETDGKSLRFRFVRFTTYHTITVDLANIVRMDTLQAVWAKRSGICHLYITCCGAQKRRYRLPAMPEQSVRELLRLWSSEQEET